MGYIPHWNSESDSSDGSAIELISFNENNIEFNENGTPPTHPNAIYCAPASPTPPNAIYSAPASATQMEEDSNKEDDERAILPLHRPPFEPSDDLHVQGPQQIVEEEYMHEGEKEEELLPVPGDLPMFEDEGSLPMPELEVEDTLLMLEEEVEDTVPMQDDEVEDTVHLTEADQINLIEEELHDPEFDDLWTNSEEEEEEDKKSYQYLLRKFAEDWMNNECHHKVSKTASTEFWNIARKWMLPLASAFKQEKKTKFPKFEHIRRKLVKQNVPRVSLDTGFVHKETKELSIVRDTEKIPLLQFPPDVYERVFEVAKVKVYYRLNNSTVTFFLPR